MLIPDMPTHFLREDDIERFWRDGVIVVRGLYPPHWVEVVRQALNGLCGLDDEPPAAVDSPWFRADAGTWHTNDRVRDFSLFAPTAHLVRQVLRSERLHLFGDQIFVKQAHNSERTPWHHDMSFFPLSGEQMASVWTSVDPVGPQESALEFIVGSHRWPQRFRPLGVGGVVKSTAALPATPDFEAERHNHEIASWYMEPGDAVIFHALTVHGSRGKPRAGHRRAISTRWCGDDARFTPTGCELQVAWPHGLKPGDAVGGPIFPQVLPEIHGEQIAARMRGPVPPDPTLLAQNRELSERFERVQV